MIFVYLILLFLLGISVLELFEKKHMINITKLCKIEYFCISLCTGMLLFTLYMFILALLNIKFTYNILFIPLLINVVISVPLLFVKIKHNDFIKYNIIIDKKDKIMRLINVLLNVSIIIVLLFFLLSGYSSYLAYPDEFSYWGLQAKVIFISRSFNCFDPYYPNFLPSLYSGYYFLINEVSENGIRIFQGIFMIITYYLMYFECCKKQINVVWYKALFLFIILFYTVIDQITSSSYSDISFMLSLSFACIYLIKWVFDKRDENNYFLMILFSMISVWTKRDGLFLLLYNFIFLFAINLLHKKYKIEKIKYSKIVIYALMILTLAISWQLYLKYNVVPEMVTISSPLSINLNYSVSMINSMKNAVLGNIATCAIFLAIFIETLLIVPRLTKEKRLYSLSTLSFVFINFAFLVVCYLTIFGGEGLTAASFVRYMLHSIPLMILYCLELLSLYVSDLKTT